MASTFIGINRGKSDQPFGLTVGAATAGTDFEVRMDTGKGSTRLDLIKFLKVVEDYVAIGGKLNANFPL